MKKIITLFAVLAFIMSAPILVAEDNAKDKKNGKKVITFAVSPDYPPMEFIDSRGEIAGFGVDYFTAVCREIAYEAVFIKEDFDNITDGILSNKYDAGMASMSINKERRAILDFTIPYYIVRQSLLVTSDKNLNSIYELNGKKVGTQIGNTAESVVATIPGAISVPLENIEKALNELALGQLDAVICEEIVASDFLSQADFQHKLKIALTINTPGAEELFAVPVKKGNLDVLIPLNDGIKAVKKKGIENELRRKWLAYAN